MDTGYLRSFLMITELGSFRRAAARLYISQPSLSQQIKKLEAELGVSLFDRSRRPIEVTEPGRVLLARVRHILRSLDDATKEVSDFGSAEVGSISVGTMQYLAFLELPDILASFLEMHPGAEMRLRIGNTGEVRSLLTTGQIDFAILHAQRAPLPPNYVLRNLRTEALVVIAGPDTPMAQRAVASWSDLELESFIAFRDGASIQEALLQRASLAGFLPHTILESADIATAVSFVARGLGLALVPESLARHEKERVSIVKLSDDPERLDVFLAWDGDRYRSHLSRMFMAHVAETLGSRDQKFDVASDVPTDGRPDHRQP